jgi:hypothetical protein
MECQCGCGEIVSDASFKPGHDQRLRIDLERRVGGIDGLRTLVENFEKGNSGDQARIDECKKEIEDIFKRIGDDQSEYDKQLLTLSSGFLAVSLAFIKDVVPLKDAEFLFLLYSSFVLLALCIILVLFSYQFSISGQLKAHDYWEKRKTGIDEAFPYLHAVCVMWLNRISGVFFGIGVLLVVFFVVLNISEAKMGRDRGMAQDGALIKAPADNGEQRGSIIKAPPKPAPAQPSSSNSGVNNQQKKP